MTKGTISQNSKCIIGLFYILLIVTILVVGDQKVSPKVPKKHLKPTGKREINEFGSNLSPADAIGKRRS
jgi:hypothetical protein